MIRRPPRSTRTATLFPDTTRSRSELSSLRVAPSAGAAPITADRVTMTVEGQDPGFSQPGRVDIAATALRWNSMTLERAAVGARGTLNALDVTLDSEGQWQEPFPLAATARVKTGRANV